MADPLYLGIAESTWRFINTFADWFAAIGSILAAVVALYIASRATRLYAQVSVGHRLLITTGESGPPPEYVWFRIVNKGDRTIRVTQIGWRWGLFKKRYAMQMYSQLESSPLPVELSHGQEAHWAVPFALRSGPWVDKFSRSMMPYWKLSLWTLRGQFHTSVGHVFQVKPEDNLLVELEAACKKIGPAGAAKEAR